MLGMPQVPVLKAKGKSSFAKASEDEEGKRQKAKGKRIIWLPSHGGVGGGFIRIKNLGSPETRLDI